MGSTSRAVSKEETHFETLLSFKEEEEEEEDDFDYEESMHYDQTETNGLTCIRDLEAKTKATFRGVITWKTRGFTSNSTKLNPDGLFICRIRVGDSTNYQSFIQVNAFGESGKWMNENLQKGETCQFIGLRLKTSDRRYNPLSHPVEYVFDKEKSAIRKNVICLPSYPDRQYYNFLTFDQIVSLPLKNTCIEIVGVVLEADRVIQKGRHSIQRIVLVDRSLFKCPYKKDKVIPMDQKPGIVIKKEKAEVRETWDVEVMKLKMTGFTSL